VQDEITGLQPGTPVRWQMPTRAAVAVQGGTAVLQQEGQELRLVVLAPDKLTWSVAPAEPPPDAFNAPNPGVSMLSFTATAPADGALRLAVMLGAKGESVPTLKALAEWKAPDEPVNRKSKKLEGEKTR
jgi:hypothetical protein